MSETVMLARIQTAQGTSQMTGKPWRRWDFFDDQNTKIGSTFQAALGNAAQAHVGGMVDVDREHDGTGFMVKAVRPASGSPTAAAPAPTPATPAQPPTQNGGQYFRPRDPKESRAIIRQTALKAAVAYLHGREVGSADITGLAGTFEVWLTRPLEEGVEVGGFADSDSIPF